MKNIEYYALICTVTNKIIDLSLGLPKKRAAEYIKVSTNEAEKAILYSTYNILSGRLTFIDGRVVAWGEGYFGDYTENKLRQELFENHPEKKAEYEKLSKIAFNQSFKRF